MKVRILQEDLVKAASTVARFSSSKVQLPVLANVLLRAKDNKLRLAATNLEISVSFPISAKIEDEGELTVLAKSLHEIIVNLDKGQLFLESDKERLLLSGESFQSQITGMNATDFPDIPQEVSKDALSLVSEDLIKALAKVLFSVSNDETRPVLTGVLIVFTDKSLTLVSTDGFRLSKYTLALSVPVPESFQIILPKSGLSELTRISQDTKEILFDYRKNENQLVSQIGPVTFSSRIIDGQFPGYEKIIPQASLLSVSCGKEELLKTVKLASVFARDSGNVIKFNVKKDGTMEVYSESGRLGKQTKVLPVKTEGEVKDDGFTIAFNYRFVEEFLNNVKGESIEMKFNDANSSGVFLDISDKQFLHIIMPIRL